MRITVLEKYTIYLSFGNNYHVCINDKSHHYIQIATGLYGFVDKYATSIRYQQSHVMILHIVISKRRAIHNDIQINTRHRQLFV